MIFYFFAWFKLLNDSLSLIWLGRFPNILPLFSLFDSSDNFDVLSSSDKLSKLSSFPKSSSSSSLSEFAITDVSLKFPNFGFNLILSSDYFELPIIILLSFSTTSLFAYFYTYSITFSVYAFSSFINNLAASLFKGSFGLGYSNNCGRKMEKMLTRSYMGDQVWLITSRQTLPELKLKKKW